ncbi:MAG: hypothetical protein Q9N26_08920, partial [Aquificota bacterium]|nr:hypothetical protein [Aquificota bacterium]
MGGKILPLVLLVAGLVFGGFHKLDYELLKIVREDPGALTTKSLTSKLAGEAVPFSEVKVLTRDGKVKVVNLSRRSLRDLMNDPNIVYIEAPRPVKLLNDIVRDDSIAVHAPANQQLDITPSNKTDVFTLYLSPKELNYS